MARSPQGLYTVRHSTEERGLEELRRMRTEAGLTQVGLAKASGVDRATINKIEQRRRNPTIETLEKLARAMGVEISDFFPKVQAPLLDPDEERRRDRAVALRWALERAADNGEKVVQAWKAGGEFDLEGCLRDDAEAGILLREWGAAVGEDPDLRVLKRRLAAVRKVIDNLAYQMNHSRPAEAHTVEMFRKRYAQSSELPTQVGNPGSTRASSA